MGLFVTSDKGKEKAALREAEDLIGEVLVEMGFGEKVEGEGEGGGEEEESAGKEDEDIEKDILTELEGMRGEDGQKGNRIQKASHPRSSTEDAGSVTRLGLVTLDIPCVSFVRLPSTSTSTSSSDITSVIDPVDLVYRITRQAYLEPLRPRSRFIKRLTPLIRVRKFLNEGLERLCDEVLPSVFGKEQGKEWKYAIRVTVRNNSKVSRDEIIKKVAGLVMASGMGQDVVDNGRGGNTSSEGEGEGVEQGEGGNSKASPAKVLEHKVDLKNFEKLVMVDVYRNVVGMSVVGEAREFEDRLRRFNLSEIYSEGRKNADEEKEATEDQ